MKFHRNCQIMEGALNSLSYSHPEWKNIGLTTPILDDTCQVMYGVIPHHSREIGEIRSRVSTKQRTRILEISFCFDQALEH